MVIALLRRTHWVIFISLTGMLYAVLNNLEWSNTYLLYLALLLSMAWLAINVLTQSIRNRSFRQLFATIIWFIFSINVLGIDDNVSQFLNAMGFSIGSFRVSLMLVAKIIFFLGLTLWISISLGNFLDRRLQRNDELAPGLRVLIGKVIRITLIIIAVLIALSGIGIDLTIFSVLSGAIGVGIGFGLQKVVSNFMSGLIILADRSIKPGDTISLGETFGWIRELRARFVSVVTRDGREYLIPNEDFITREVINWSFSDDLVRLDVPFGVDYSSDPHQVSALAIEAAGTVSRVVVEQAPVCWMTGFGDSSLDFVLRFWIRDPQKGMTNIRGQVLLALWDIFKANDISIPYPHRQLVASKPIPITTEEKGES
ncbi:mechanosensitive ion channel [Gammaproteobacteria bacterium]|nr:mechanosensitive ion channel [Gammaproteobacteria bacterium]